MLNILVTHPTAIFITDVKAIPQKPTTKANTAEPKPSAFVAAVQASQSTGLSELTGMEIQAGMIVSLGPDAARLRAKLFNYLSLAKKAGVGDGVRQVKIAGETWYRSKATMPGDKNRVTFGFHGKYFIVGVGRGSVEGRLARWNRATPAWLSEALEQTQVARRTGIVYLNLKAIRDKLLPLAPSQKDAVAALETMGLYNVDSLVSTTGLEDYGMINRVLLCHRWQAPRPIGHGGRAAVDGQGPGADPARCALAVAARVDLDRTFKTLLASYEKAGVGDTEIHTGLDEFKKTYNIDIHRLLASLGDAWCVYNSPTEGEMAFLGWTAVVPVRDRAALLEGWEKLSAMSARANRTTRPESQTLARPPPVFCQKSASAALPDTRSIIWLGSRLRRPFLSPIGKW